MENNTGAPSGLLESLPEMAPVGDVTIHTVVNGWLIHTSRPPGIVIEKVDGRDNMACLLAQVAAILGERQA